MNKYLQIKRLKNICTIHFHSASLGNIKNSIAQHLVQIYDAYRRLIVCCMYSCVSPSCLFVLTHCGYFQVVKFVRNGNKWKEGTLNV